MPRHLASNGGVKYEIGDTITLSLGTREFDGSTIWQDKGYMSEESLEQEGDTAETEKNAVPEQYIEGEQRTYQVVGIYERGNFESYSAPGYTALTVADSGARDDYESYFSLNNPDEIYDFVEHFKNKDYVLNNDLLRYLGVSNDVSFNSVLYGLAAVLIAIIMIGSVSLIYNAFSISVSERTKAFGLLSSIGATKKQMRKSIFFEARYLCLFGIPLGVIVGISGIGITLHFLQGYVMKMLAKDLVNAKLSLHVSVASIIIACVIGFVTVMVSAWIPAKRALKINAIDAIRQSQDIKINPKKIKASWLSKKLFGFEGLLGDKNYKRNKKKYRATVASLFISVVLFISASSFQAYLKKSADTLLSNTKFDLSYYSSNKEINNENRKNVNDLLSSAKDITKSSYYIAETQVMKLKKSQIDTKLWKYYKEKGRTDFQKGKDGLYQYPVSLCFIDDATYKEYLEEQNLNVAEYMDSANPKALVKDSVTEYSYDNGSEYFTAPVLQKGITKVSTVFPKEMAGYTIYAMSSKNHSNSYDNIIELLQSEKLTTDGLYDQAANADAGQALILVVNVFAYGFVILISLIATANVFNTISTNIGLRRSNFFIPWESVFVAIISVFVVVFATMLYSMKKINKDNPIDALKNENL